MRFRRCVKLRCKALKGVNSLGAFHIKALENDLLPLIF
ncbi:hypothetical protein D1BOALGB6SA_2627 [Olavius sp. associated proteobacterium Delta 1]|nr:hypothetical protein D1BOALGB6SA_2627 [Olavius sp. associated proteobacterium Delta 1]